MKENISLVSQDCKKLFQIFSSKLKVLETLKNDFSNLLKEYDKVSNKETLEKCEKKYKILEEAFEKVLKEAEEVKKVESEEDILETVSNLEEKKKKVEDKKNDNEQQISKKEDIFANIFTQYDTASENSRIVDDMIATHHAKIKEYISRINQIQSYEIVMYRSRIASKSLALAGKVIRRNIEAKVLESFVPKKVADFYLVMKLVHDTKKIMQQEDEVITRKEVDTSYYQDIYQDQLNIKDYQGLVKESLVEIKQLQNEYRKSCEEFPDNVLFLNNIKRLEELEDILLKEAVQLEEVVDQYDDAMEYNEQKIKVLRDE